MTQAYPSSTPLVTFSIDDGGMLLCLADRSQLAENFVTSYLMLHTAPAKRSNDPNGTYSTVAPGSGLSSVAAGTAADRYFGAKGS